MTSESLRRPSVIELCAGAGGQALGLEAAGFHHRRLIEIDPMACATLRANRPYWPIEREDIRTISLRGSAPDLLAAGLPCPPFSIAGQQLGPHDERNLFEAAFELIAVSRPTAVLIENVRGLATSRFASYRALIEERLLGLGYKFEWKLLNACNYGVPQLRPRFILVAVRRRRWKHFRWPEPTTLPTSITVGEVLHDLMAAGGWKLARSWARSANRIAPTIVGGSKKHGGPDLGPSRAREAWATLNVDGSGIAAEAPIKSFIGMPKLTLRMVARLQGFDDSWQFAGTKTSQYRQIGNAFPPPVAEALGNAIARAF
jgi:DNA (cytosine-5)-methyltransferase 1